MLILLLPLSMQKGSPYLKGVRGLLRLPAPHPFPENVSQGRLGGFLCFSPYTIGGRQGFSFMIPGGDGLLMDKIPIIDFPVIVKTCVSY